MITGASKGLDVGKAVGYLDLDTTQFREGLIAAGKDLKVFKNSSLDTKDRLNALSKSMVSVGKGLTLGLTAPLVGAGVGIAKVTANFEAGMSEVQAISGATGRDFEALKEKAKEMGAKTKFSATESAEALKYMAMAGWDTNKMLAGLPAVMNLAAASGENLGTVSDIVTDALTAFKMEAGQAGHFADVLAVASSKSNTNVGLMGETFKYVAPVAGALGYTCEDTAVAIGLMANAGIKGSQAGTALRSMLTRLAKPSREVQSALDDLGLSIADSNGNIKPFNVLLKEMRSKFKDLTKDQQAQYAATIAGQEGMSGLLAIVGASDKDFETLTKAINKADGAADKMAKTMNDNFKGQITILKSTLEGIGISLGETLVPYLKNFVGHLQGVANGFNAMSKESKEGVVQLGLFAAGLGPVLLVGGKFLGLLSSLSGTSVTFTTVLNGLTSTGGAVGGVLGLLAYSVYAYAQKVKGATWEVENMAKAHDESITKIDLSSQRANNYADKFSNLIGVEDKSSEQKRLMKVYVDQLNGAMEGLNLKYDEENDKLYDNTGKVIDNVDAIKQQTEELKKRALTEAYTKNASESLEKYAENSDKVTEALRRQAEIKEKISDFYKEHKNMTESEMNQLAGLQADYQSVTTDIKNYQDGMAEALVESQRWSNMVEIQSGALKSLEKQAAESGVKIPESLIDGLKSGQYMMPASMEELNDLIKFDKAVQEAKEKGIEIPSSLQAGILNGEIDVADATKEMNSLIKKETDKLPDDFKSSGDSSMNELKNSIDSKKGELVDVTNAVVNAANQAANQTALGASAAGNTLGDSFSSAVQNTVGAAYNAGYALSYNVDTGVNSVSLYGSGQYMAQGFANGMYSLIDYVGNVASSIAQRALNSANRTLDNRSPSHKAEKIGKFGGLGLGVGFLKAIPQVEKDAKKTTQSALDIMNKNIKELKPISFDLKADVKTNFNEEDLNITKEVKDLNLDINGLDNRPTIIEEFKGMLKEALSNIKVDNKIDVVMNDGDVYLDSERVGRKVAPVVSRLQVRGV